MPRDCRASLPGHIFCPRIATRPNKSRLIEQEASNGYRTEAEITGDGTEHYLCRAMPAGSSDLDTFNDDRRSYDEIRAVIVAAREIAQAEIDANRQRETCQAILSSRLPQKEPPPMPRCSPRRKAKPLIIDQRPSPSALRATA
jgi:hypothetical protein